MLLSPPSSNSKLTSVESTKQEHFYLGWMILLAVGLSITGMAIGLSTQAAHNSCIETLKTRVMKLTTARESLAVICSQTSIISNTSLLIDSPRVFLFRYGNATSMTRVTETQITMEDPRSRPFYSQMIALPMFQTKMLTLSLDATLSGAMALRMFCTNGLQYFGANVDVRELLQDTCYGYGVDHDEECAKRAPLWTKTFDDVTMCIVKK